MRRLGTVVLTAFLATGVWAAPAHAARVDPGLTISAEVPCSTATGHPTTVNWSVLQNTDDFGMITSTDVSPAGSTLQDFDHRIFPQHAGPVRIYQSFPPGSTSATLTVEADLPGPVHVSATRTVSIPTSCEVIHPTVTFDKQCNGDVLVNFTNPASNPDFVAVYVLAHDGSGGTTKVPSAGMVVPPGKTGTAVVPASMTQSIEAFHEAVKIRSTGPLAKPASCGQPQPAGPALVTGSPTLAPTAEPTTAPAPGPVAATATVTSTPTSEPAPRASEDDTVVDVALSALGSPAGEIGSSIVVVVLALFGAYVVYTLRRRRVAPADPADPAASNDTVSE